MARTRPDIYEMLKMLSPQEKEALAEHLRQDRKAEKAAPPKTYLEERWADIQRLIEWLKYEPFIDDQIELGEIWEICGEIAQSDALANESWTMRRNIIVSILQEGFYDGFGVMDPMLELFHALMRTQDERQETGDWIAQNGTGFVKEVWAKTI